MITHHFESIVEPAIFFIVAIDLHSALYFAFKYVENYAKLIGFLNHTFRCSYTKRELQYISLTNVLQLKAYLTVI